MIQFLARLGWALFRALTSWWATALQLAARVMDYVRAQTITPGQLLAMTLRRRLAS